MENRTVHADPGKAAEVARLQPFRGLTLSEKPCFLAENRLAATCGHLADMVRKPRSLCRVSESRIGRSSHHGPPRSMELHRQSWTEKEMRILVCGELADTASTTVLSSNPERPRHPVKTFHCIVIRRIGGRNSHAGISPASMLFRVES
jgi:hypothetical protein